MAWLRRANAANVDLKSFSEGFYRRLCGGHLQDVLDTLLYLKAGRRVLKKQVLGFCGVKTKRVVQFGSVKLASPAKIQGWLRKAGRFGAKAAAA